MRTTGRQIRMVLGLVALTFVLSGSMLFGGSTIAGSLSYTPPVIDTKPVTPPSGPMTLTGAGFIPNSTIEIFLNDVPLGTTTASPTATCSFNFQAPPNLGTFEVHATDGTNDLTTSFRVVADGGGGGGLPFTGSSSSSWLTQIGVGLLAAGAIIVALVRSKARKSDQEKIDINA